MDRKQVWETRYNDAVENLLENAIDSHGDKFTETHIGDGYAVSKNGEVLQLPTIAGYRANVRKTLKTHEKTIAPSIDNLRSQIKELKRQKKDLQSRRKISRDYRHCESNDAPDVEVSFPHEILSAEEWEKRQKESEPEVEDDSVEAEESEEIVVEEVKTNSKKNNKKGK